MTRYARSQFSRTLTARLRCLGVTLACTGMFEGFRVAKCRKQLAFVMRGEDDCGQGRRLLK